MPLVNLTIYVPLALAVVLTVALVVYAIKSIF